MCDKLPSGDAVCRKRENKIEKKRGKDERAPTLKQMKCIAVNLMLQLSDETNDKVHKTIQQTVTCS